ncbi:MAG: hypothetical protein IKW08_09825 [Roseburia sp.]|nr:hypothetical protein [Roseburia sp.]
MCTRRKDYSESTFRKDVEKAQASYERGDIDWETYKGQVKAFASWYGEKRKLAVELLSNRNFL